FSRGSSSLAKVLVLNQNGGGPLRKIAFSLALWCCLVSAQLAQTQIAAGLMSQPQAGVADSQAPVTLTLQDSLQRAKNLDPTYRAALTASGVAREDHLQARAALLPGVTENTEYLYTEGTGTSTPNYIANNAVHEYVA